MFASKIQVRAALLAVIALAVIAAFSATGALAATSRVCEQNPYTQAGRDCIEQASVQPSQVTVVQKVRHRAAKKHRLPQCPTSNPYANLIYCR
jgi:hypothetical protein